MNDFVVLISLVAHSKAIFCVDVCDTVIATGSADFVCISIKHFRLIEFEAKVNIVKNHQHKMKI
jgi:hypothetical protein